MRYDPDIHHRRFIRLRDYDYSRAGAYFVTICTSGRECLFGEVVDGLVGLNGFGKIVQEEWMRTPTIRPNVELDAFVVMPNHFHAIIIMHDVGAHCMRPGGSQRHENRAHVGAPLRRQPDSIGSIIAGFKSAATKRINEMRANRGAPVWQRNYHEHVIRNEDALEQVRQYIFVNPARWEDDENHPSRCP